MNQSLVGRKCSAIVGINMVKWEDATIIKEWISDGMFSSEPMVTVQDTKTKRLFDTPLYQIRFKEESSRCKLCDTEADSVGLLWCNC